jgi:hypothetical protein
MILLSLRQSVNFFAQDGQTAVQRRTQFGRKIAGQPVFGEPDVFL